MAHKLPAPQAPVSHRSPTAKGPSLRRFRISWRQRKDKVAVQGDADPDARGDGGHRGAHRRDSRRRHSSRRRRPLPRGPRRSTRRRARIGWCRRARARGRRTRCGLRGGSGTRVSRAGRTRCRSLRQKGDDVTLLPSPTSNPWRDATTFSRPVSAKLGRALKRALQDDQNDLLNAVAQEQSVPSAG